MHLKQGVIADMLSLMLRTDSKDSGDQLLSGHTRWDISLILWIYFMNPSGVEPIERGGKTWKVKLQ